MKFLNRFFNHLIAAGLVLYGLYFYLDKNNFLKTQEPVQKADFSSVDHEKRVNEILQATTRQILKDQHNSKKVLEMAQHEPLNLSNETEPPGWSEIPRDQQIHKETPSLPVQASRPEKMDKKEYARQYIENARKGGYHIELSDDLEVISVTPLRQPSQEIDTFEILPSN